MSDIQFNPDKASREMTNAIKRYRSIHEVLYYSNNDLYSSKNSKPAFTARQQRYFSARPTQQAFTSTRNHSNINLSNSNNIRLCSNIVNHYCKDSEGKKQSNVYSRFKKDFPGKINHVISGLPPNWSEYGCPRDLSYKQDKMMINSNLSLNGSQFKPLNKGNNKRFVLKMSHTPRITPERHYFIKNALTSITLTPFPKIKTILTNPGTKNENSECNETSRKHVHFDSQCLHNNRKCPTIAKRNWAEHSSTTSPMKTPVPHLKENAKVQLISPKLNSLDTGQTANSGQDKEKWVSCNQFADSILQAAGLDLTKLYELYQTKYRYSELIERSHPELFLEDSK